jgi:D-alanyl-D-alanine carboxypeptidase/D-alanyl-D-alanine-endopeptidase (penicillin-binding protein 4)
MYGSVFFIPNPPVDAMINVCRASAQAQAGKSRKEEMMSYNYADQEPTHCMYRFNKRRGGCRELAVAVGIVVCAAALVCALAAPVVDGAARGDSRPDIARFRARVERILAEAPANRAYWGILVADRDTGKTLYALNADHFYTPASNAKLITTALALAELGPDYRFQTTLESNGALGSDGRLSGDLILVGRGDPDLSNRIFPFAGEFARQGPIDKVFSDLVDAAVGKGLREVDGDIVADDSYFPYDPYPAGWSVGDLFFDFGVPVSAITFNDNVVSIVIMPGERPGEPAVITTQPAASLPTLAHSVTTSAPGAMPQIAVVRQPGANFLLLRGTIPAGHAPVKLDLAMIAPAETAARTIEDLLEKRGVRVMGGIRVQHSPPPETTAAGEPVLPALKPTPKTQQLVLAEHLSPPLSQSVELTNKISQNLHAEIFLRTVGLEKLGLASTAAGLKVERGFLQSAGIPDGDVILTDGSGLSRDDLVTPRAMVDLLRFASRAPWAEDFLKSLPVSGVNGTLNDRMRRSPAKGLIEAKTGATERVHSLTGYATTVRGEYLVFSIFCNNDAQHGTDATKPVDDIATAMVETLGPVPAISRPARATQGNEQ